MRPGIARIRDQRRKRAVFHLKFAVCSHAAIRNDDDPDSA
jgi:hypothetical protein